MNPDKIKDEIFITDVKRQEKNRDFGWYNILANVLGWLEMTGKCTYPLCECECGQRWPGQRHRFFFSFCLNMAKLGLDIQMNQPQIGRGWSRSGQLYGQMAGAALSQPAWGDKRNNHAFHTGSCKPAGGMVCSWLTSGIQSDSWFRFQLSRSIKKKRKDFNFLFPSLVPLGYHLNNIAITSCVFAHHPRSCGPWSGRG